MIKHIAFRMVIYALLYIVTSVIMFWMHLDSYSKYLKRSAAEAIAKVEVVDGIDMQSICNATNCSFIKLDDLVYKPNEEGVLQRSDDIDLSKMISYRGIYVSYDEEFIFKHDISYDDYVTVGDESFYVAISVREYTRDLIIVLGLQILVGLLISLIFEASLYIRLKRNDNYEKRLLGQEMATRTQIKLGESLYHEISIQLATLKVLIKNIIGLNKKQKEVPDRIQKDIRVIFDSVENVMQMMTQVKNIKRERKDLIDVYDVIMTTTTYVNRITNTTNFNRIEIVIDEENTKILSEIYTEDPFSNSILINILNNMITNSKEALADKITFRCECDDDYCKLYIQDNGVGIKNSTGAIIKNKDDIFKSGFTTKIKTKKEYFKSIYKFVMGIEDEESSRGMGLYFNKTYAEKNGGKLELSSTSSKGTVFVLTFPYKR